MSHFNVRQSGWGWWETKPEWKLACRFASLILQHIFLLYPLAQTKVKSMRKSSIFAKYSDPSRQPAILILQRLTVCKNMHMYKYQVKLPPVELLGGFQVWTCATVWEGRSWKESPCSVDQDVNQDLLILSLLYISWSKMQYVFMHTR